MPTQRTAVFSDIHSNYHAFKACYNDAVSKGADRFIFLGDYISDLAEPERTLDLVYEIQAHYPTICLRGNRERYILEHDQGNFPFLPGSKTGSLLFTYEHLRTQDLDFFRSLPISDTVSIGDVTFEAAHASMDDDRCYFEGNDPQTELIFQKMNCNYLLTGHSHKQYIQQKSGKTIINPGSVGIPQGGTVWPKYALIEIEAGAVSCSLHEVPYDMRNVICSQFDRGLVERAEYWAIGILYDIITGKECALRLLDSAAASGNVYDESSWYRAALQLGMRMTKDELISLCPEYTPSPC